MNHSLSPEAHQYYEKHSKDFLDARRAVTPSWHLQFSEALGNFSFHCAQRIVEAFDGRLLYAGGDDVLAMLPAKDALPCARALRAAFRGEADQLNEVIGVVIDVRGGKQSDRNSRLFQIEKDGYLQLHQESGAVFGEGDGLLDEPVKFPALLPGPETDVSVGIAIAHQKAPLQDVVRAAQAAEKRAKNQLGRAAVATTILKRSGEILEWGCKWAKADSPKEDSAGYQLLNSLTRHLIDNDLNSRFPHKVEALLTPYLPDSRSVSNDDSFVKGFATVLEKEAHHALKRDGGGFETGLELFTDYWAELSKLTVSDESDPFAHRLTLLINLLRTAAWSAKTKKND